MNLLTKSVQILILPAVLFLAPSAVNAQSNPILKPLIRVGPWKGVSALISYRGRLWFANSEKFVNHNSADIYSYAPGETTPRYEQQLFSQDAGEPLVADGLLFWPFEDSRFTTSHGEFMVTNGRNWRWQVLTDGEVFHVHALIAKSNTLYAATSAWRAGLQQSKDSGRHWQVLYDHPTAPQRVSRFTSLGLLNDTLYAGLTSYIQPGPKLYRFSKGRVQPQPGWPDGVRTDALQQYKGWLYAANSVPGSNSIWRTDGKTVEPVLALDNVPIQDFAVSPNALWAISGSSGSGRLWRSADGLKWQHIQSFGNAFPLSVTIFADQPYVGTQGPGALGTLWGPVNPNTPEAPLPIVPIPEISAQRLPLHDLKTGLSELDEVLQRPAKNFRQLRKTLSAVINPLLRGNYPGLGNALSRRLKHIPNHPSLSGFGNKFRVHPKRVKQWYLLKAIAQMGEGTIPVSLLELAWDEPRNSAEKYFHPLIAALWAIRQNQQQDKETLNAIISRLGTASEPPWLDGDRIGALTVLTGQKFGYDITAWKRWWHNDTEGHQ